MKQKLNLKKYIPNLLTVFRVLLAPIIICLLLIESKTFVYTITINSNYKIEISNFVFVAGILFILASLSDLFDGYLARKWKTVSEFGKFWDPIADKILVNGTLFCLASVNQKLVPIWIPIIILVRDFIIDGLRLYLLRHKKIVLSANIFGKIKTCLLIFGILVLIYFGNSKANVGDLYYWLCQNFLIYLATISAIFSGVIYIKPMLQKITN